MKGSRDFHKIYRNSKNRNEGPMETNRINNFYTKSLRNFFLEDIFIFLWLFGVLSCLKTLFLDFHQEELSYIADI